MEIYKYELHADTLLFICSVSVICVVVEECKYSSRLE